MCLSFNLVNLYAKLVNVYQSSYGYRTVNNKKQMVTALLRISRHGRVMEREGLGAKGNYGEGGRELNPVKTTTRRL